MDQISLRIRVEEDEDYQVAQETGSAFPEVSVAASSGEPSGEFEGQVEPITMVLIGAGVVAAVQFVMTWWEKRRGGLVIDQRPEAKDDVYRDRDLNYGYVLIYPRDGGDVRLETKDMPKDAVTQLLEAVVAGAFKSAADLAKAAKDALGASNVKTSTTG